MKLKILTILISICPTILLSQLKTEKLSFEFGYGINKYSMGNLNQYFIDSVISKQNPKMFDKKIEKGQKFDLSINYRPSKYFNVGLFSSYQHGSQSSDQKIIETDVFGNPIARHDGNYKLKTQAISFGVNSTLFLNTLLKLEQKNSTFLQNLKLGIGLNGGVAYSKVTSDLRFKTLPYFASQHESFESMDFQGQAFIDIGYYLSKNNLFSSIGMKLGYQYFVTKTVRDRLDNEWIISNEYPINLDFSGFFIGTYIMIGK